MELTVLLFLPTAAAVIIAFLPQDQEQYAKWVALGGSVAALALSLVLAVAACGGSGREGSGSATAVDGVVAISAFEWGFEPETITLEAGEPVRFDLTNDGRIRHNLKIDGLDAEEVSSDDGDLFVEANDGESASLAFTPTSWSSKPGISRPEPSSTDMPSPLPPSNGSPSTLPS